MPRKVKIEGRSMIRTFSYPISKEPMMLLADETARKENRYFSELVVTLLEDYVKIHSQSNNPQTQIEQFDKESVLAIPNAYASPKAWDKFYLLMKNKKDYDELSTAFEMILSKHNEKLRDFD